MIRHRILLAASLLSLAAASHAENFTQANVQRAQAVIDAAVQAYGGADRLAGLTSLVEEHKTRGMAVDQSLKTRPPWDQNSTTGLNAIDLANQIFVTVNAGDGGGFEFDTATIIEGDRGFQLDYRAGTATPLLEPDYDTAAGPYVRVTPVLLVKQLQSRAHTAHHLGQVQHNGSLHDVIGFTMEVGPAISLYFDTQSHLLTHSERVLAGFGVVEYGFSDYETVDGILFNRRFLLHLNGELNLDRENFNTKVNVPLDPWTRVDDKLKRVAALQPDALSRKEIGDATYLIGGNGTYAMFVEMADYVIAVGGTAGMPDRIALLREVVPDKPIRYGVLTHHHSDHVLAVPTYAQEGATVVASAAHAAIAREAAGEGVDIKLKTVDDRLELADGKRQVEIIDIGPTAHTAHLLVAWLPQDGILFEADHFAMPRSGPAPPAVSGTRTFAQALKKHKIEPTVFASAHSPRTGSMTDLKAALAKEPMERTAAATDE